MQTEPVHMKQNLRLQALAAKIVPILREAGVARSDLFGSVVRGDDTKGSDIDILIEAPEEMSLFDLAGLQIDLKEALHKEVDLITYNSIHPLLKEYILKDTMRII